MQSPNVEQQIESSPQLDFIYQAIGSVKGLLIEKEGKLFLRIGNPKVDVNICPLKPALVRQLRKFVGGEVSVMGYPRFNCEDKTRQLNSMGVIAFGDQLSIPPGIFKIQGNVVPARRDRSFFLRIIPKDIKATKPFKIPFKKSIEGSNKGELWRVDAKLGDNAVLTITDSEKLKDARKRKYPGKKYSSKPELKKRIEGNSVNPRSINRRIS